ncbi:uncharacterized protein LOC135849423 [Planococcus citri]|uniref:uncharacterized protein LOC135849423 n=1 Tax=Planococcus citri TaxID=170843 RepID=UPI0031F9E8D3
MMGHSSILIIILIAYLAYSFGVMIPYKNNTAVEHAWRENISITCTDDVDEVTWTHSFTMGGNYSIKVETPRRKVLKIKNASLYNIGVYECVSIKNRNEFMRIYVSCDVSCWEDDPTVQGKYYETPGLGETYVEITN